MIERSVPSAGDPFAHAGAKLDDKPCGCWDGWHWLGIAVEDPEFADGEDVVYERVPCRRCNPS